MILMHDDPIELEEKIERLEAKNQRLRGLLREVEWDRGGMCPICDKWKHEGHSGDCGLAKELSDG
jgi:RecA-family ATPase